MRRREFTAGLGSAAVWPLAARAQQPAVPVIGFLDTGREYSPRMIAGFWQGLREQGYVEGQNVGSIFYWAETQADRLASLAADLVRRRVAVIMATGGSAPALAAKAATGTIPIIFTTAADPVELGLVASLNRPGSNLTGVSFLAEALVPRRFQLLRQIVPSVASLGYLINPSSPQVEARVRGAEAATRTLGVKLAVLKAGTANEIDAIFANLSTQRIGALLTDADPLFYTQRDQVIALAAYHGVPAMYQIRDIVDDGGLVSYGANLGDVFRLAGNYAGRILKGDKPADLPVQQPVKFEMVINLNAARALGLAIPPTLLALADEVIE
jgi:putative ABC transport system substrate-binding protein